MVYSKYGSTFRKIREQKRISLSIFPEIGISKPALSKFERGETMMGFEKVVCALQAMGVTLEEYEYLLNAYSASEEEELWEEVQRAAFKGAVSELHQLQYQAYDLGLHYMYFAIKACYMELDSQESEEVTDYLYDVQIWSFSELQIFYFCMGSLHVKDILHLLESFFPSGHQLFNSKKHRQYFVQLCCRAIVRLSSGGYQKEAKEMLKQLDTHGLTQTMFQRNLRNLTEGYWMHRFEDQIEGEKKVMKGLEILSITTRPEECDYYRRRYALESDKRK